MSRTKGTFSLTSNIEPKVGAPLDARTIVKLKTDLTASGTFDYPYIGLTVFVEEENKKYTLIGLNTTVPSNWMEESASGAAADITYDNTTSQLQSTNVQDAIDELNAKPAGVQSNWTEDDTSDLSYIQNKPENLVQDANYVHTDNNYDDTSKGKVDALGTASTKDIPASGDASNSEVVLGNDTRLTDARPASDVSSWAKAFTKPTYTASEVGAIASTLKGTANGVAELDDAGKVPSSQLPSFVDDVIEVADYDHLPISGESGKIYVTLDTNKTYRWTGSGYAEISESLALGETSSTAYRGDRGKTAYDHATETKLSTATASGLYKVASTAQGHIASLTAVQKSDITALGIPESDTNTTYTFEDGTNGFKVTPSGGTAQTVTVTPSITNNVTGSGTNGYLTKFNGTNTITNGPQLSSAVSSQTQTTKFLREDGSWAAPSYTTNTDANVTQNNNTTNADYRLLLSNGANDTNETKTTNKSTKFKANPSTGVLNAPKYVGTVQNFAKTGSGTAATTSGSNYIPAKWTFNLDITASEGDVILITVPVAGHSYGVFLSANNGTNYYPIVTNGTGRLTTQYGVGTVIALVFDADGSCASIFPLAGGTDRVTVTGGVWRVVNFYDSGNTNTAVTQTATTDNADYEVLFSATADNTTRTEGARKNNNMTFNPSTGNLKVTSVNGLAISLVT